MVLASGFMKKKKKTLTPFHPFYFLRNQNPLNPESKTKTKRKIKNLTKPKTKINQLTKTTTDK